MSFADEKLKEIRRRHRWEAVGRVATLILWALDTLLIALGGATVGWWLHG